RTPQRHDFLFQHFDRGNDSGDSGANRKAVAKSENRRKIICFHSSLRDTKTPSLIVRRSRVTAPDAPTRPNFRAGSLPPSAVRAMDLNNPLSNGQGPNFLNSTSAPPCRLWRHRAIETS